MNQIRTWVRQGRTDAWIAHQLQVTVKDIDSFKHEYDLVPGDTSNGEGSLVGAPDEDLDLRAEDDALVAAALDEEADDEDEDEPEAEAGDESEDDGDDKPKRRRRGRRGGRGRPGGGGGGRRKALEGTFDHGDEGYGLWLDPAIQDDPVYAEHWAGHRPVAIAVEPDRIVIRRLGDKPEDDGRAGSDGE
ncbi:MAG: hypothetical protein WD844_02130 [Thermoleophilaceae bacterium]